MLTEKEREDYEDLINTSDYPDYLKELIEKKFVEKSNNWYKEHFKK